MFFFFLIQLQFKIFSREIRYFSPFKVRQNEGWGGCDTPQKECSIVDKKFHTVCKNVSYQTKKQNVPNIDFILISILVASNSYLGIGLNDWANNIQYNQQKCFTLVGQMAFKPLLPKLVAVCTVKTLCPKK